MPHPLDNITDLTKFFDISLKIAGTNLANKTYMSKNRYVS